MFLIVIFNRKYEKKKTMQKVNMDTNYARGQDHEYSNKICSDG